MHFIMILLKNPVLEILSLELIFEKQTMCYAIICLENLRVLMNEQGAFFIYYKHVFIIIFI